MSKAWYRKREEKKMAVKTAKNSIYQTMMNESKKGAYYTDPAHCRSISTLFNFPKNKEVCALEPSCGDGVAIEEVVGHNPNVKLFGVELDEEAYNKTKEKGTFEEILNADFTNGVKIKNQCFSFIFTNPPYLNTVDEGGEKDRTERQFLEFCTKRYIKKGGVIVLVIPYSRFIEKSNFRLLCNNYENLGVWKFRESEYKKYKQIVFVGRKTSTRILLGDEIRSRYEQYDSIEKVSELPESFEGTELYHSIEIEPSDSNFIDVFTTREFDFERAMEVLKTPSKEMEKKLGDIVTQPKYTAVNVGAPPTPLKKDHLYLMATSGAGMGIIGREGIDLHLQRGVAKIVNDIQYEDTEDKHGKTVSKAKVTSHTAIKMIVIETDGTITDLTSINNEK